MKKGAIINIVIAVFVIASIIGIFVWLWKRQQEGPPQSTLTAGTEGATIVSLPAPDGFPLQKGSRGSAVKFLQSWLNDLYGAGLTEDGDFGANTQTAAIRYLGTDVVTKEQYSALSLKRTQKQKNARKSAIKPRDVVSSNKEGLTIAEGEYKGMGADFRFTVNTNKTRTFNLGEKIGTVVGFATGNNAIIKVPGGIFGSEVYVSAPVKDVYKS